MIVSKLYFDFKRLECSIGDVVDKILEVVCVIFFQKRVYIKPKLIAHPAYTAKYDKSRWLD